MYDSNKGVGCEEKYDSESKEQDDIVIIDASMGPRPMIPDFPRPRIECESEREEYTRLLLGNIEARSKDNQQWIASPKPKKEKTKVSNKTLETIVE